MAKLDAPKVGAIVLYRKSAKETFPLLITSIGDDDAFSGQAFLEGTERQYVENTTFGKGVGQCAVAD